jgi:hypothetical protein
VSNPRTEWAAHFGEGEGQDRGRQAGARRRTGEKLGERWTTTTPYVATAPHLAAGPHCGCAASEGDEAEGEGELWQRTGGEAQEEADRRKMRVRGEEERSRTGGRETPSYKSEGRLWIKLHLNFESEFHYYHQPSGFGEIHSSDSFIASCFSTTNFF